MRADTQRACRRRRTGGPTIRTVITSGSAGPDTMEGTMNAKLRRINYRPLEDIVGTRSLGRRKY